MSPGAVVPVGKGIDDVQRFCADHGSVSAWFPEVWRGGTDSSWMNRAASFLPIPRSGNLARGKNTFARSPKYNTAKAGAGIRPGGAVPSFDGRRCEVSNHIRSFNPSVSIGGLLRGLRVKMNESIEHFAAVPSFYNPDLIGYYDPIAGVESDRFCVCKNLFLFYNLSDHNIGRLPGLFGDKVYRKFERSMVALFYRHPKNRYYEVSNCETERLDGNILRNRAYAVRRIGRLNAFVPSCTCSKVCELGGVLPMLGYWPSFFINPKPPLFLSFSLLP